jgi:transposase InsO family protein
MAGLRRGEKGYVAGQLRVELRTVELWAHALPGGRAPGRPRHSAEVCRRALWCVARAMRRGRLSSWRAVKDVLGDSVPTMLQQQAVAAVKARARLRNRRREDAQRVHVEVLVSGALWCQDAGHLGRLPDGGAVQCELVRDAASPVTAGLAVGPPACGADAVAVLERTAQACGGYPLVHGTDNGPQYVSSELAALRARERVIHLRNRPHTPTDNSRAERGIGELKGVSGLGSGVVLASLEEAAQRLGAARDWLDHELPRAALGGLTAVQADALRPRWYALVDRETFHAAARSAIAAAVVGCSTARARRAAEREAIYQTMERYKLIRRTRGGAPLHAEKREGIS